MSCTHKTFTINKGSDVKVTLEIKENKDVQKIEFTTRNHVITLDKKDLTPYDTFIYSFNVAGEDGLKTCVYTTKDVICTEVYVEKNYKVKLVFDDNELKSKNSYLSF